MVGFESNKVRALLVYLAINSDRSHNREELAGLLWPDRSEQVARGNLRQALANLRQTLGDETAATPYLLINRESVQFNTQSDAYLDVTAFTSLIATADHHLHRREEACHRCARWLEEAVSIYRGNFLEHFAVNDSSTFEEWALTIRERLRQLVMKAFLRLGAYYERRGEYESCLFYGRRLLELDPWQEEVHRQIIRALALSDQRNAALVQYEACRRMLEKELGVEPADETQLLYQQIKSGLSIASYVCQPSRLPHPLTPFLGRAEEIAALSSLLESPSCRMVTVVGPGGIGKTRLALKVAEGQVGSFHDGVFFVSLATLLSGDTLPLAIAETLGLPFTGQKPPRKQLIQHLRGKEMLLVLDNFEHLLGHEEKEDATLLLVDILQACPQVSLLITSREHLNLQVEQVFAIGGLPFPPDGTATDIEDYEAVQLFFQQAQRADRSFAPRGDEARAVVQICRMADGNPLAIELAAGGIRSHSCRRIAEDLELGLQTLVTTMRDIPERHRSLRAIFDHSWSLLSPREQICLSHLSVFRGGIPQDAAAQVAGADASILAALANKSLLALDLAHRFRMHELSRQYAWARLCQVGEAEAIRNDHLAWFLGLAEQTEPALYTAAQQTTLERLDQDHDNLRAALTWALDSRNVEAAARLAGSLSRFWGLRGHLSEGRMWLDKVLVQMDAEQPQAVSIPRARALLGAGALAWRQGDYTSALSAMETSLAIFQTLRDAGETRRTLRVIATVESSRGNDARAIDLLEDLLERDRQAGDQDGIAYDFGSLADSLYFQGNWLQAKNYYNESLAIHRQRKDDYSIAICLNNLGEVVRTLGDFQASATYIREAISLFRQLGIKQSLASGIMNLGELEALLGEDEQAQIQFCEALALQQALSAWGDVACILPDFAALALKAHEPERAARLYAISSALREAMKISITPAQLAECEANTDVLRRQLGETAFKKAWEAGSAMTMEQAVDYALRRKGIE